jgi:hypothetical protein
MEFNTHNILDYDKIRDLVDTNLFTNLDGVEIIDEGHPFIHFLKGLTVFIDDKIYQNILHGWFHKETATAKFLVTLPSKVGNFIIYAWKLFIESENADVYIYSRYCGQFYKSNEFEVDEKTFYKNFYKKVLNHFIDKLE